MIAEFYIVPGDVATLLGRKMFEMLKVGVSVNNCDVIHEAASPLDNKTFLKAIKISQHFWGPA